MKDVDRRIADVIARTPRPEQPAALVALGEELGASDPAAATRCYDRALGIDGRCVAAWVGRASVLAAKGTRAQAIGCIERALEVSPEDPDLVRRREALLRESALASSRNRRFSPCEPEPTPPAAAPEPTPEPEPAGSPREAPEIDECALLHAAGRHIEALRLLEPVVKAAGATAEAWMLRGSICAALGEQDAAATSYERATKIAPDDPRGWMRLARTCAALGRTPRAERAIDEVLRLTPGDAAAHKLRGTMLLTAMRGVEAVVALEKACHYAPEDGEAWLELGRALRAVRRRDAAREALTKAIALGCEAAREVLAKIS